MHRKFILQIDNKQFAQKPTGFEIGGIKKRTQKSEPQELTIEQFVSKIKKGCSYSLGILKNGLGATNWTQQQLFAVDIDNDNKDQPILNPKEASNICQENGVIPAIVYHSFSSTSEKPKFRLIFALKEPVYVESKRQIIAQTLTGLFPQADTSCINADRIFFGTNKEVKYSENIINFENILELCKPKISHFKNSTELDDLKVNFDFKKLLDNECGEIRNIGKNYIMYKNCPICKHKDDFVYYPDTNTFKCFGAHGGASGSIIDYLINTRNMDKKQAIECFKYELCGLTKKQNYNKSQIPQKLETISAYKLMNTELAPLYWSVENLIVQGLTLLASPPKFGKSWLMLDLCHSVATEKDFLGFRTYKSRSLYLALEDSPNRLKSRIEKVANNCNVTENFELATKADTISKGLINTLETYINEKPDIKLIVIDTLQKIRGLSGRNENKYAADYDELGQLKFLADKYSICIVVVHHLRKAKDDDVFNKILGTNAIMGVVDTALVLTRDEKLINTFILHITGRDVECDNLYLCFDKLHCRWTSEGNAETQNNKREIKEYNDNPITKAIRKFAELEPNGWTGTIQELMHYLKTKCGYKSNETPATFAKKLNKLDNMLKEVDDITHIQPPPNGSNGKRIHKFLIGFLLAETDMDSLLNLNRYI